ncbi:DUF930 domain-containing protein [Pararhizobium arenae]|uniref:DUF930 domain-containing protein n=1 Tax=Pararhizobium arenae TaxID=1856850 RepID=UPI00094B6066|nr:DUF930 domain-containing protein [Pararhizobium arenae]
MQDKVKRDWKELSWGTIVSIAFHVVVGAILLYQLPMPDFTPPEEETVSVEMVPPPPEEAEEPPPEEEAEQAPPPPAEEQPQQEPPPAEQAAQEIPIPVLRPVFEFGEKDTGNAEANDGDAAREAAKPAPEPVTTPEEKPIEPTETAEIDSQPALETLAAMAEADPADAIEPLPEVAEIAPEPEKTEPEPEDIVADIPEAKKLFSKDTDDNPIAQAAMGDLPRSERIARLCSSELYAQLKNGSPSYNAELVPSFELPKGNELKVPKAAFRSKNRWYDIAFRCEVDADGMRVVSFGVDVGAEVPKSQWRSRGFPSS